MVTLVSDKPDGPFHAAKRNFRLLAGHTYFSRFFPTPDGVLVNHHAIARNGQVYFAPLKQAVVDDEGTLRLGWWTGNEKMKHESIELKLAAANRPADSAIVMLENVFDVNQGVILEGTLALPEPEELPNGLYIECKEDRGSAILVGINGMTELGAMCPSGCGFEPEKPVDREMGFGKQPAFRLLLRHCLLEFYLDDILVECYSLPTEATGRIGLIQASSPTAVENLRAWR